MTTDIDIYRAANVLIKQHGQDAPIQTAMRHDKLLEAHDIDGAATWKRILQVRAVDELMATERPEGQKLQ